MVTPTDTIFDTRALRRFLIRSHKKVKKHVLCWRKKDGGSDITKRIYASFSRRLSGSFSHPASSITLSGFFGHFVASNVQDAIKAIDQQLSGEVVDRRTGQRNLNTSLTSEVTARQTADTTLTTSLGAHAGATAAHGSDGDVVGATTLANAIGAHAGQTTNVHGLVAGGGNLVGTDATQTLTNKTLENPILH